MNRIWSDLHVALRGLRRSPAFTVSAVLVLGIGMGMAIAMWSVFQAVLLRRLPIPDANRVVFPQVLDQAGVHLSFRVKDVDEIRRESRTMSAVAGYAHGGAIQWPMMDGDRLTPLMGSQVQWQFFQVLDVKPVIGRLLGRQDDSLSHVMVLSYDAWQRYFGADPAVIGKHFRQALLGLTYTVVGVAPPGIDFPAGTDYWSPMPFQQIQDVIARLAPGATPAMARQEFRSLAQQAIQEWGGGRGDLATSPVTIGNDAIRTINEVVVGDVRPALILLVAAVGLLLLIVCTNIGNLQLLRAASRSREIAIRRALGATYRDVVGQLMTESTVLAVAGGILGLIASEVARRALIAAAPAELPRLDAIRASGAPIGMAIAVVFLSVILFGLAPAFIAARRNPASPLRLDTRSGTSTRQRRRLRQLLVGSQVALALMLLAGAALLSRSLQRLQSLDLGYRADHLSVLNVLWPYSKYPNTLLPLWDKIAPRIRAVPGVISISPTVIYPLVGMNLWTDAWQTDGETREEAERTPRTPEDDIGPDYFRTLGVPMLRGRTFT